MNHMPGHTYVLCGDYLGAKLVSEKAIIADDKYGDYAGLHNFYTTARCHDLHLMMFACMMLGQYKPAAAAMHKMCDMLPIEVVGVEGRPHLCMTLEGYHAMAMHVFVRFGKWREIIESPLPEPANLYCVSTAMHHYAKGIAHATLKQFDQALAHQASFFEALAQIPPHHKFFNNPALDILGVAEKMLEGELTYHQGDFPTAFNALRESVIRNDELAFSEPWPWMHPPRHALAALLSEQGLFEEAETVYRDDLGLNDSIQRSKHHPNNVWALHGLVECLRTRGAQSELATLEPQLSKALLLADVPIESSCLCRTTVSP